MLECLVASNNLSTSNCETLHLGFDGLRLFGPPILRVYKVGSGKTAGEGTIYSRSGLTFQTHVETGVISATYLPTSSDAQLAQASTRVRRIVNCKYSGRDWRKHGNRDLRMMMVPSWC